MSNEVTIKVKTKDESDFNAVKQKARSEFGKAGDDSGRSFGASVKKWFTGEGGGLFTEIGKSGGTVFGSGLLGAVKTPILGPALMAGFAATVATVMPAVGAIAGGALVTGVGAGMAGLGLVVASKSQAVKDAWSKTMGEVGADMKLISKPFEGTLIQIAGIFQRTVGAFSPYLQTAFGKMAGPIGKFADDAGHALEGLLPAIGPITDAFNAVLRSLGPALQSAVGNVGKGLKDLAESVSKNPDALADLVRGLGDIVHQSLDLITTLNKINTGFSDLTGGVSLVEAALKGIGVVIGIIAAPFQLLAKGIELVNAALGRNGSSTDASGKSMADAATKTALLAQGLGKTGSAALDTAPKVKTAAEAAAELKQKFEDSIVSLFRVQNLSLSLSSAQIGLQAAIDDATASIKENGHQHDINSEKGRANKTALDAVAKAANAQSEAMLRNNNDTAGAAKTAEQSRAKFISLAEKMGYSAGQAKAMAAAMIAIPNVTREAKLKADKTDLETKLAAARTALDDKKLTATKRAKLEATITSLMDQVNAAQARIDRLHGKTVGITVKYTSTGVPTNVIGSEGRRATGGTIFGYAGGGSPRPGNSFLVGEDGPELVSLSGGVGRVTPAANTRQMLRQSGVQKVVFEVEVKSGPTEVEQFIATMVRKYVTVRGGNVQQALGGR